MKIYITGSPGSGKTTLAREISRMTGIEYFSLDEVMHEPDPENPGDNRKRDPEKRDEMFHNIISKGNWIVEDAGRTCFRKGQELADNVVALVLPKPFLLWRVSSRHIKQLLGIEKAQYRADMTMFRMMHKWVFEYDINSHIFCPEKTVFLKNTREIAEFLAKIQQ